ncbi:MAG: hypothetical protein ACYTBJ_17490 [Planctomycetota bacterium]|jgi:hypothetical protein
MSKIAVAVMTAAALFYALWLVVFRRELPQVRHSKGLRRRFLLATLLFVGLLGTALASDRADKEKRHVVLCYRAAPAAAVHKPAGYSNVAATLKAVWRTLDPRHSEEFRQKLEAVAAEGKIRHRTADMLAVAYEELALHKRWTRTKGPAVMCYEPTVLGATLYTSRENALKQIELLEKARQSGAIDAQTAAKAHAVLAREVEAIDRAKGLESSGQWAEQQRLVREYEAGKIAPGDSASVASAIIVAMEDGAVDLTPAARLATMKARIEKLLMQGPAANDWIDPDIRPNVSAVLEKAGLIANRMQVECYKRGILPVKARSEQLQKLQQELLDKNVQAGVLDVEVAEKAAAAQKPQDDYATDKDIRQFQKKVRRVVRLLYRRGELPSSFVEEIEKAADIDIISFDQSKALRNDVRYYLRSAVTGPDGDEVLKVLEKHRLIPTVLNLRLIVAWPASKGKLTEKVKKKLAEFERLIDSDEAFGLPGDSDVKIEQWRIPQTDIEYRLKIRRVCRAFLKTGLAHHHSQLSNTEEAIGIPLLGALETR